MIHTEILIMTKICHDSKTKMTTTNKKTLSKNKIDTNETFKI